MSGPALPVRSLEELMSWRLPSRPGAHCLRVWLMLAGAALPHDQRADAGSSTGAGATAPYRRMPQRNGFHIRISFGISVSAPRMATVIATVVRMPKMMLGTKFDNTSIEKPQHTVSVV